MSPRLAAALIFAAVVFVRLPFATTHLWAWDSVLYARALEQGFHVDTDLGASRPHPPGYIWYVGAAQLARTVFGDSNAALVFVSILASAAAAALLWLVASRWMRPGVALVVTGGFALSPLVWTYSEIAYPYTVLGLASLALGALFIDGRRPLLAALAFGLISGARTDVLILLAPLWIWSMRGLALRRIAVAAGVAVAGILAWSIPSAILSDGPLAYLAALGRQAATVANAYSVPVNGIDAFAYNLVFTAEALGWGLVLLVVPLAFGVLRALPAVLGRGGSITAREVGLVLWIVPALLVYVLVHIGEWGQVLGVLPALFIAAGVVIDRAGSIPASPRWLAAGATAVLLSAMLFVGGAPAYAAAGGRADFTAGALVHHDRALAARIAYVRRTFPISGTVILAREDHLLVRYYLAEYRSWYWDPDPYAHPARRKHAMRSTTVVIFTAGLQPLVAGDVRRVEIAPGITVAHVELERGDVLELRGERYVVRESGGR